MGERKKLKISCGTVDCKNGLHCYRQTKREAERVLRRSAQFTLMGGDQQGQVASAPKVDSGATQPSEEDSTAPQARRIHHCKECGARLVDWERLHHCDIADARHTFTALRTEWIRHHFWHRKIDHLALAYAYKKGRTQLKERLKNQIRSAVGRPARKGWDGRQTSFGKKPKSENILYFAQHATASCCRECVEGWHGILRDRPLTEEEIDYLTALAVMYLDERLPKLPNEPGSVPPEGLDIGTVDVADFEGKVGSDIPSTQSLCTPVVPASSIEQAVSIHSSSDRPISRVHRRTREPR